MRQVERTSQFKRDYKRESKGQHRQTLDGDVRAIVTALAADKDLAERHRDHALVGEWKDHRDCHIKPDLVLIYRKTRYESTPTRTTGFARRAQSVGTRNGWQGFPSVGLRPCLHSLNHYGVYGSAVKSQRRCSRSGCVEVAIATLTYVYSDSTAVVGPLATFPEPHTYDLCDLHARRMTAPRGWELVRRDEDLIPEPTRDDLAALADAVREAAKPTDSGSATSGEAPEDESPRNLRGKSGRRGHLKVIT